MGRNSLVAGAALAAALSAACRRAEPPSAGAASGVPLEAPAPSSATLASPLGPETSGYTNEMQAQTLREEAAKLGIDRLGKPSEQGSGSDDNRAPLTFQEGLEQTRQLSRDLEAQRHALEKDKPRTVALPGQTPRMLPGRREGAPIEPAPDETGPKDPEIQ